MKNEEFSNQFDILVNSYRRFRDFDDKEATDTIEFDEYEKSLYLTKAQEEIVLSLYNGRNSSLQSFEETEELRRYLSNLIREVSLIPETNTSGTPIGIDKTKKTRFFTLPENLWFITYESVSISDGKCGEETSMEVVPVTQDEYHRIRKNPFRGANNRRSLRLDLPDNMVEIISKFTVTSYYVRYLMKLEPIVLDDLPDGVSIEGVSTANTCKVHEGLHQRILERAVEMALQSRGYIRNNNNSENR